MEAKACFWLCLLICRWVGRQERLGAGIVINKITPIHKKKTPITSHRVAIALARPIAPARKALKSAVKRVLRCAQTAQCGKPVAAPKGAGNLLSGDADLLADKHYHQSCMRPPNAQSLLSCLLCLPIIHCSSHGTAFIIPREKHIVYVMGQHAQKDRPKTRRTAVAAARQQRVVA